ncbi:unnamed protein product [Victoria cruziana]
MNNALKISSPIRHVQVMSLGQRVAHIHYTAVLERRRRTQWDSRCSNYSKRFRRMEAKRTLLRNVSAYADYLFQSWNDHDDPHHSSRNETASSWYKKAFTGGARKANPSRCSEESPWQSYRKKSGFHFYSDEDEEVENIFRYAFFGNRCFYWSFTREEDFNESSHWRNFSGNDHRRSWSWRYGEYDPNDSSAAGNSTTSCSVSDRLILGLNASGPLKLEDVKSAYRTCALKWHPDRHQGSSKNCSLTTYTSCDQPLYMRTR